MSEKTGDDITEEVARRSVKKRPLKKAPKASKPAAKKEKGGRGPAYTFPKSTLENALLIARAIEDKNAGNPMRTADLVRAVGFNQPNDWRFQDLLRSANQYGLVVGNGVNATVSLAKIGEDVVAPSSPVQRQNALLAAFRNVEDFKRVEEHYQGKKIPEDEFFENTVIRDFGIPRERVKVFGSVFRQNLAFLNLFNARRTQQTADVPIENNESTERQEDVVETPLGRVREFLDTCFVMMPFGQWFDRYYREVYAPAIKEAGFEPIRGDELFSSGTVVEQIWEQVVKATVLIADLSEKNANVFYELGLAHAARKPVVLTAHTIDDVPFDLRHLRVIVYDIREPDWAEKLKKSVTDYLRNAKAEPAKSIPQPFRDLALEKAT